MDLSNWQNVNKKFTSFNTVDDIIKNAVKEKEKKAQEPNKEDKALSSLSKVIDQAVEPKKVYRPYNGNNTSFSSDSLTISDQNNKATQTGDVNNLSETKNTVATPNYTNLIRGCFCCQKVAEKKLAETNFNLDIKQT